MELTFGCQELWRLYTDGAASECMVSLTNIAAEDLEVNTNHVDPTEEAEQATLRNWL